MRAVIAGAGTESCTVTIHDPAEDHPSAGLAFAEPFQSSERPQIGKTWVVCLEDKAQNTLCIYNPSRPYDPFIPYYYAWYFDAGMDGPVGADVNYSTSRPDVLKVDRDFTDNRGASFVQLARLSLQTEGGTQEIGVLTVNPEHDGDGAVHTFQVKVPRDTTGTLHITKK